GRLVHRRRGGVVVLVHVDLDEVGQLGLDLPGQVEAGAETELGTVGVVGVDDEPAIPVQTDLEVQVPADRADDLVLDAVRVVVERLDRQTGDADVQRGTHGAVRIRTRRGVVRVALTHVDGQGQRADPVAGAVLQGGRRVDRGRRVRLRRRGLVVGE